MNKLSTIKEQVILILKNKKINAKEFSFLFQKTSKNDIIISRNNYIFATINLSNFNDSKIYKSDKSWIKYLTNVIDQALEESESEESSESEDSEEYDNIKPKKNYDLHKYNEIEQRLDKLEAMIKKMSNNDVSKLEKRFTILEKQVNGWD